MLMGPEPLTQPTRLFVGGIPQDVTPEQIAQRFKSFGTVQSVDLAPEKEGSVTAGPLVRSCRGFAYVQLTPKDAAALHRCISMYNGCKWMGGVLRVEPAKPDYKAKFAAEEADELRLELEGEIAPEQPDSAMPDQPSSAEVPPLTIPRRDGKKTMKTQPNRVKTYFPPVKQPRADDLAWGPVEAPPGALTQQRVNALLTRFPSSARIAQAQAAVPNGVAQGATKRQEAAEKVKAAASEEQMSQAAEEDEVMREKSSESEELGAVDFMDSDVEGPAAAAMQDSRFDSSDEDDDSAPAAHGSHAVALTQPSDKTKASGVAGNRKGQSKGPTGPVAVEQSTEGTGPLVDGEHQQVEVKAAASRIDSSDDEEGGAAALEPAGSLEPAGMLGLSQEENMITAADDSETDENETDGGLQSASGDSDSASSSNGEGVSKGNDMSEDENAGPAGGDVHAGGQIQALSDEVGAVEEQQGDRDSGSEGEDTDGGDAQEHGSETDEAETSSEHSQEPGAGMRRVAAEVGRGPELPAPDAETNSDLEEAVTPCDVEGASHGQRSGDMRAQQGNEAFLAGLAEVLPQGAAFCRLVGGNEVEAAWRAARDSLVADYKSKRRTALKQLPTKKRGRFHA